jgi:predicted nucleotidyltransferase
MDFMERKKGNTSVGRSMRTIKRTPVTAGRNELTRVKRLLRYHLPKLRERYGVVSLGVFGSYVRGEAKRKSDLDVLVEFRPGSMTLFKFVEMENYLTELLGVKVDLVMKSALKPAIGKQILAEVVML